MTEVTTKSSYKNRGSACARALVPLSSPQEHTWYRPRQIYYCNCQCQAVRYVLSVACTLGRTVLGRPEEGGLFEGGGELCHPPLALFHVDWRTLKQRSSFLQPIWVCDHQNDWSPVMDALPEKITSIFARIASQAFWLCARGQSALKISTLMSPGYTTNDVAQNFTKEINSLQ
ncbi:hypothetical protein J6590_024731 [Homalodisca vitripennis]|nr:hypothetical protein J6590_024731 [Homalodisca vitripennis]